MRIVYIGTVDFSEHCLRVVLENRASVVGIVTSKDPTDNSDYCDLTPLARQHHIPIHYCQQVNDPETVTWIRSMAPDVIFCWGFSQMIKADLLSIAPKGVIGVHATLLPENRGRHPLIWSLALGLKESGLTFFRMDAGADSGPILSQARFTIGDDDNATTLYAKVKQLASRQIGSFLPELTSGTARFTVQEAAKANSWRKRSRSDGRIDWRMCGDAIVNLVRALARPYPGADFLYKGQVVAVWQVQRYWAPIQKNIEPGKIIEIVEGKPIVKCYDTAIVIMDYQPKVPFVKGEYL